MPPDPETLPHAQSPVAGGLPPLLTPAMSPGANVPPVLPDAPSLKPRLGRQMLATVLSLCLIVFLADGIVSLLCGIMSGLAPRYSLQGLQMAVGLFAALLALLVYGLMALTPMVPKRFFLPLTLFFPVSLLAGIPLLMMVGSRMWLAAVLVAVGELGCGLLILRAAQGRWTLRWPLVPASQLGVRGFAWRNLIAFLLLNALVLLPAAGVYLLVCTSVAVSHYSAGFMTLRPGGLSIHVRKYVRPDGKTVQLVPMAHVGDAGFYGKLAASFPTNAIILMEGVSDDQDLLTNHISYERMATSLGLAEQQKEFKPAGAEQVRADVDVSQFAPSTIGFLNVVMRIHGRGLNAAALLELLQSSPPPEALTQLWEDLLTNRNRHLLGEIQTRLLDSEHLIVPWGAAHMPGLAEEILKAGFQLEQTQEFVVIRFGGPASSRPRAKP